jgi:hypothetical protein
MIKMDEKWQKMMKIDEKMTKIIKIYEDNKIKNE